MMGGGLLRGEVGVFASGLLSLLGSCWATSSVDSVSESGLSGPYMETMEDCPVFLEALAIQ